MSFTYVFTSAFSHFSGNAFTIPDSNALYWMHIGIDVPATTQAHLQVTGTKLSIWKTHAALNGIDTMTNDGFVQASQGTKLTLSTDFAASSSSFEQPYWVGFRLDNYFSPLVAFSVALSTPFSDSNVAIPFDIVLYNIGNGWQSSNFQFIPPQTGIYFFRFSAGVVSNNTYQIGFKLNDQYPCSLQTGLALFVPPSQASPFDTFDVVSRTCMVEMQTSDIASIVMFGKAWWTNDADVITSSTVYQQTTFKGFLYSPISFPMRVSILNY